MSCLSRSLPLRRRLGYATSRPSGPNNRVMISAQGWLPAKEPSSHIRRRHCQNKPLDVLRRVADAGFALLVQFGQQVEGAGVAFFAQGLRAGDEAGEEAFVLPLQLAGGGGAGVDDDG